MRKIKDILRLRHEARLAYRGIASALNIGYGTVVDYLNRAEQAGISWPIPEGLNERDLGRLLFPTQPLSGQRRFTEPDFPTIQFLAHHIDIGLTSNPIPQFIPSRTHRYVADSGHDIEAFFH